MPVGAIAQISPCCLSTPQVRGSQISNETQPSLLATSQVFSMSHFWKALLKHQNTIDCWMRPLVTAFPSAAMDGEVPGCNADAAPATIAVAIALRRLYCEPN